MDVKPEQEKMDIGEIVENVDAKPTGTESPENVKVKVEDTPGSNTSGASAATASSSEEWMEDDGDHNGPIVIIMVGMAASGKTSLTQRITSELMRRGTPPYIINLDPACLDPPYPVNIDIRDVVKYKKVMEVYNLGPNGAIVTSLNLFSTKFDEVINIIKQKRKTHQYVLIDTPGQIEVFMWSASGSIITESLAALFPTVMIYVTDLISNVNPITFISNMTYACSMLYKSKLPLIVTLNKCDAIDPTFAKEWITDFDAFDSALQSREEYTSNLASSLALGLEEFYNKIEHVVVSAYDGFGMDDFFNAVQKSVKEYETVFRPMYEKLIQEKKEKSLKKQKQQLGKLKKDLRADGDADSCFVVPGRDAGTGMTLRLDNEDDSSTDDEDANVKEENEEESFSQVLNKEANRRSEKYSDDQGQGSSGAPSSKT
ncbi:GPN-loop GTPase 1 [Orchesella cincta]|uniref:GPN-loop GTPase n=1 Tax=Orchesella cincta TaxID=48709 RepID=A0A1D2MU92_ORCCI|nr:GPN-loop GTPase 1 [Orchesella cincta]